MDKQEDKIIDKELAKVNGGIFGTGDYYSNNEMPKYVGHKIYLQIGFGDPKFLVMLDAYDKSKKEATVSGFDGDSNKKLADAAKFDEGFPIGWRIKKRSDGKYTVDYGKLISTFFSDAQ